MNSPRLYLLAIVAASLAAVGVVAFDAAGDARREAVHRQFQSLVGGLGLGSHNDLARCPWLFDPRVADEAHAPFSLSAENCPWHSISIFPAPGERLE